MSRAGRLERIESRGNVDGAFDFERAKAWIAAHEHDIEHRVVKREVRFLWNDRHAARAFGSGETFEWPAIERDVALRGRQCARQQLDEGGLARAIRPEDADDGAGVNADGNVSNGKGRVSGVMSQR